MVRKVVQLALEMDNSQIQAKPDLKDRVHFRGTFPPNSSLIIDD